jgi:hypothetical protein
VPFGSSLVLYAVNIRDAHRPSTKVVPPAPQFTGFRMEWGLKGLERTGAAAVHSLVTTGSPVRVRRRLFRP